jgi:hypothetical protein
MFLTAAQLAELTGYVKPSKQIEWLRRNGVPHFVNAAGRPVVKADMLHKTPVSAYNLGPVR